MSPPLQVDLDLLTLKVVSESRDVADLCANFSLPRPLCTRPMYATDRRHMRINASALWGRGITS